VATIRYRDCLCNRPAAVTLIEAPGQRVGLSGTEKLFSRWASSGWDPSDLTATQVLSGLRDRNCVGEAVEEQYVEAVRARYVYRLRRSRRETSNAQG
jgi:hypothetical protein